MLMFCNQPDHNKVNNQLIVDLAKSDFAKKLAAIFGVDLGALDFSTPEQKFETSVDKFSQAVDRFAVAPGGILSPSTITETDITGLPGLIDFAKVAEDITSGAATVEVVSQQEFSSLFQDITGYVQFGLESVGQVATTGFSSFFTQFGDLINEGLKLLTESFSSNNSGSEAGIFTTILKGIGGFFGFGAGAAKGRIIPGSPSDKDDQIIPVAPGEAITNARAVQYYGKDFMNAINDMTLPHDFYDTLQGNSVANSLAMTRPRYGAAPSMVQPTDNRPINVTIIDKSPKLDPSKMGLQEKDVTTIFVDGVRKDRIIRKVIHEDLSTSRA